MTSCNVKYRRVVTVSVEKTKKQKTKKQQHINNVACVLVDTQDYKEQYMKNKSQTLPLKIL